jgi:hypothetical protein
MEFQIPMLLRHILLGAVPVSFTFDSLNQFERHRSVHKGGRCVPVGAQPRMFICCVCGESLSSVHPSVHLETVDSLIVMAVKVSFNKLNKIARVSSKMAVFMHRGD